MCNARCNARAKCQAPKDAGQAEPGRLPEVLTDWNITSAFRLSLCCTTRQRLAKCAKENLKCAKVELACSHRILKLKKSFKSL